MTSFLSVANNLFAVYFCEYIGKTITKNNTLECEYYDIKKIRYLQMVFHKTDKISITLGPINQGFHVAMHYAAIEFKKF